jgi:hypothetical protein
VQHELSTGQILRASYLRAYFAEEGKAYLAELPPLTRGLSNCYIQWQSQSLVIFIQGFQLGGGYPDWYDASIPSKMKYTIKNGFFCKTQYNPEQLKQIKSLYDLKTLLEQENSSSNNLIGLDGIWSEYARQGLFCILLTDATDQIHCFLKISADEDTLSNVTLVCSSHTIANPQGNRILIQMSFSRRLG